MKIGTILAIGGTIAAAAMFAACGGGSDAASNGDSTSNSKITTQHGLAVAALFSNSNVGGNGAESGDLPAAAPADDSASISNGSTRSSTGQDSDVSGGVAPQAQADGTLGITVQGFGVASADPDSAVADFYFYRYGYCCADTPLPEPLPPVDSDGNSSDGSNGTAPDVKPTTFPGGEVEPIEESDVQSVIDALTNAGVSRDDIEFVPQTYVDPYNASATLHVTIDNIDIVDAAVSAATDAGNNLGDISTSSSVNYTLQDCDALETAALEAAVTDAGERGAKLAGALNVTLGSIIGASDYSWSPSGVPCSGYGYPMPVYYDSAGIRAPGGSNGAVQVVSQISVTYAMN